VNIERVEHLKEKMKTYVGKEEFLKYNKQGEL